MKAILTKYKYEIYFFYALPAFGLILGLLAYWMISVYTNRYLWGLWEFSLALASLCLFGVAYQWVKRLDQPFLLMLWQGKMALLSLYLVLAVFQALLLWGEDNNLSIARWRIVGALNVATLIAVSSWYAAKVSRQGFSKSAAYVALMLFYGPNYHLALNFSLSYGTDAFEISFLSLAASMLLLLVGVWVVGQGGDVGRMWLSLLFAASFLSSFNIWLGILGPAIREFVWWDPFLWWDNWYWTWPQMVSRAFHLTGAVSLAYLVYRYLLPLQEGRLGQALGKDSLVQVLRGSGALVKYHRNHRPFDWKIALSLFGIALMLANFVLPEWLWWLWVIDS